MKQVVVTITGAAGNIGYALLFRLVSGEIFGLDTIVHLRLLDLPNNLSKLNGVRMELNDCAFPRLGSIITTGNLETAFKGTDWALLIGASPRKKGMERNDLLKINGLIFKEQGQAIDRYANENCKILVVGNPCNTNALIALKQCKRISKRNFFAMTMLDEQRAVTQLSAKFNVHNTAVNLMTIWGNHSSTQYPDFYNATINGEKITDLIDDDEWFKHHFIDTVQQRGSEIINARGESSAASAATATLRTVKKLLNYTPVGENFSVAVLSSEADHAYGISEEVMFSFPVIFDGNNWKIHKGVEHNKFGQERIQETYQELLSEKEIIKDLL